MRSGILLMIFVFSGEEKPWSCLIWGLWKYLLSLIKSIVDKGNLEVDGVLEVGFGNSILVCLYYELQSTPDLQWIQLKARSANIS